MPATVKSAARDYTSRPRNRPVPPFVMDRPILHAFVRELLGHERLHAFAEALPARARVSEPALPLVVAALHERLERPLAIVVPEDADARDLAEGAGWFVGEERVALLPSRGVRWDSGLEPPPHLVGERARALDVATAGGLVCVSATALAERMPPPVARPARIDLPSGGSTSSIQVTVRYLPTGRGCESLGISFPRSTGRRTSSGSRRRCARSGR